jgi:putative MATE family efflux protein
MAVETPLNRQRRDLTKGSLPRTLLTMAMPIMAAQVLTTLYSITDMFWLGRMRVGASEALAAVGPTGALLFVVFSFGMGFGSGGTALVSQHTGAKRHRDADVAAGQTMLLLTCTTSVVGGVMFIFAPQVLRLMQTPPEVMPQALPFLRILLCSMPFIAFNIGYGSALRAIGDTLTMVLIQTGTNLINFGLSPTLIFGLGPFRALGIRGAATASLFASILTAVISVFLLRRGRSGLRLRLSDFRPNFPVIRMIFDIGLPAGVSMSSNSLGFLVLQGMINKLGATIMGAYTVGSRITEIIGVPAGALAISTAPVVGQALGAGKPEIARRAVRISVMMYALGMLLPQMAVMLEGQVVARAFTRDAGIIAEAGRFFMLVPLSNYCFNIFMVVMSAFFGSGHTRPAMIISLLRQWVLRIPVCMILCFGWGFVPSYGSQGLYAGLVAGNVASAAMAWWLFHVGGWEKPVVPAAESPPQEKGLAAEQVTATE